MAVMMLGSAALAAALAAQAAPHQAEMFTLAEVRAMCEGKTEGAAEFRTGAAYQLLARIERDKCRMYLLGIAQGVERASAAMGQASCTPGPTFRDELADRLVEAVLRPAGDPAGGIVQIVRDVLGSRPGCRSR
jgi:hypothetical protein